jgi:pimeloyl-ACP methyl ester carboxylesterase
MSTTLLAPGWRASTKNVNGVQLHIVDAGDPGDPLLILLHGFPEFWWAWRKQISPLAQAGYHVVVPDMRGYNLSSAPQDVEAYALNTLAADVVALAAAFGEDTFQLVGHDWGSAIAWWTAAHHPSQVIRTVVMDGPHPDIWAAQALKHPTQALKSAYVGFFQMPWLPEATLGAFDYAALKATMQGSAHADTFEPGALDHYAEAWSQPGSLTAMLNYYRALRHKRTEATPVRVVPPTLILWGEEDHFLERHVMEAGLALCDDGRFVAIEGATHWLHLDRPQRICAEITTFFGS